MHPLLPEAAVTRRRGWTVCGLALALVGPPLFVVIPDAWFGPAPPLTTLLVVQALYCALPLVIVWIVRSRERLPLSSIGLRPPRLAAAISAALVFAIVYVLPALTAPLRAALHADAPAATLARLAAIPLWFRVVIAISGGIVEETLYRGYAIERLAALIGSPWLAGAISALVFGLAHAPAWGWRFALAADLPFGAVMTAFYLWRRDLAGNILVHSALLVVSLAAL